MVDAEQRAGQGSSDQEQRCRSRFDIRDYVAYLQPDEGSETKIDRSFLCPLCGAKNFKVNVKNGKFGTFGCSCMSTAAGKQRLKQVLMEQSGSKKSVRPKQRRSWVYLDAVGRPLIEIHRQDDGQGNRKIRPKVLQDGSCSDLRKLVRPYRYQECLEAIERGERVFWVEGEPCVDALKSIGITATTTIQGSNSYNSAQYRGLFPAESLVICPDRDLQGIKYAEAIAADYPEAKWCYAKPDAALWQHLSASGGWDIADWIEEGATAQRILAAVEERRSVDALTPVTSVHPHESSPTSNSSKPNTFKRHYHHIEQTYGHRLRLNTLTKEIELDEEPIELGDFKVTLAIVDNLDVRLDDLGLMLKRLTKKKTFHPVKDFLDRCAAQYKDPSILDSLVPRYFGCAAPIHNTFLKRTLIGAVARIFDPGCKMDTALILQGKQGYGKSTFFKVLAGEDYFDDSLGAIDKDEKLKLAQTWFAEWPELATLNRRSIEVTKAVLSSSTDMLRPPYGRQLIKIKRQSIIVGTTNQDEFLKDSTGNRRFWVIPVQLRINIERLQQERDRIWGAAVALYQAGEKWWLTEAEEQQAQDLAKDYLTTHPWQSRIEAHLLEWRLTIVTTNEIINNCLEIEPRQQNRGHQMEVAKCLKRLGWESAQHKYQGKRQRVWVKPEATALTPQSGSATAERDTTLVQPIEQQVESGSNSSMARGLDHNGQPVQPQTPSFLYSNGHGAFSAKQLE